MCNGATNLKLDFPWEKFFTTSYYGCLDFRETNLKMERIEEKKKRI